MGDDGSIDTVTGYNLDDRAQFPALGIYVFIIMSRVAMRRTQPLVDWYRGIFSRK
jgi:hypothetical protein